MTLRAERQSPRMSKITNDGLTRSGTGCFIAVPYGNGGRQRAKVVLRRNTTLKESLFLLNVMKMFSNVISVDIKLCSVDVR